MFKKKLSLLVLFCLWLNGTFFNLALANSFGVSLLPNDSNLGYQDYLEQVKLPAAWEIASQSPEVVVAVIDSGVDIDHPDLRENIWRNPDEVKDGIDNDNNGYVDDINGWDFILNSPDPRPKFGGKYTDLGIKHGTIVSGVIGAVGNNGFGISGASWKIKIMPLKVMDGEGTGATNLVYQAIGYAIEKKADVINLSMVGDAYDPLLDKIIAEAYNQGIVIVAAAGNEREDGSASDVSFDLGKLPQYPICHDGISHNYVLGVGSVDPNDVKSRFSNFGSKCLDLTAPGEGFWGLSYFSPVIPGFSNYFGGFWSGTSLAVPLVSATAALIKSLRPELKAEEIYNLIIDNTDDINAKNPLYRDLLGKGRLNVAKALKAAGGESAVGSLLVSPATSYQPEVITLNSLGSFQKSFLAYSERFTGGVSLATADLDLDGKKEIITGAGRGGGPHVRIFDQSGTVKSQFFAYEPTFSGGINLIAGQVDSDSQLEIISSPIGGQGPLIRVYSGQGVLKNEFYAFEESFKGGVNLALSDLNADGIKEIVAGSGPGRFSEIRVFSSQGKLIYSFKPFEDSFGVKVASTNLFSDPRTEFVVFRQNGGDSQVRIYSPTGELMSKWSAWSQVQVLAGNISVGDIDSDGLSEIIASQIIGDNSEIKIFKVDGQLKNRFQPFTPGFKGGINFAVK